MKNPLLMIVLLTVGASTAALAQVQVHTQTFDNTLPSGNAPISSISYQAAHSASGTLYDNNSTTTSEAPVLSGGDFLFISNNLNPGASLLVYGDGLNLGLFENLTTFTFELRNNDVTEAVHVAILVGGQWYITETTYGTVDPVFFDTHEVDVATATWNVLNFTAGSSLTVGAAGTPSGDVTGYGFYVAAKIADIRVDNVVITASEEPQEPEPSTTWGDWPRGEDGSVDTQGWINHINVTYAPWIWAWSPQKWMYLPEEHITDVGAWAYIPR